MNCSNCAGDFNPLSNEATLVVNASPKTGAGYTVARLCGECTRGVLTLKIVLSRPNAKSAFAFEGYLPVASEK
jgi:hypothetical protein